MGKTRTYDFSEPMDRDREGADDRHRDGKRESLNGWRAYRAWLKMLRNDFSPKRS